MAKPRRLITRFIFFLKPEFKIYFKMYSMLNKLRILVDFCKKTYEHLHHDVSSFVAGDKQFAIAWLNLRQLSLALITSCASSQLL